MSDRNPTGINRSERSGGWAVAVLLLVAIISGGLILFEGGYLGSRSVDINVSLPKVDLHPVTR
jgi:hypothetical protein